MRSTGFMEGDQLRVDSCTPPVEIVDEDTSDPRARADVSFMTFVGYGGIGARNAEQIDTDPRLGAGFNASARWRLDAVRLGAFGAFRVADNSEYQSIAFGGSVALPLPRLHSRLDLEASGDLGAQHISATARRPSAEQRGTSELTFWEPLLGVQVAVGLSHNLELVGALRADGTFAGQAPRRVTYCDSVQCYAPRQEVWDTGGFAYGVNVGIRVLLR